MQFCGFDYVNSRHQRTTFKKFLVHMSYLWFDPSTYQKPASPRKIVRGQEGDEKLVEVVKIRNANDWGKAPVRKGGPRIEVTPTGGYGQQDASPTITAKFGDWLNHVKNDVEHFVEGTENENIQIAAPSNFHQVSHIGWDAKKVSNRSFRIVSM